MFKYISQMCIKNLSSENDSRIIGTSKKFLRLVDYGKETIFKWVPKGQRVLFSVCGELPEISE